MTSRVPAGGGSSRSSSSGSAGAGTTDQDLEHLTAMFRLLSDKTRLNILMLLTGGERNVTSLCEALDLPQPTVSHHLGLLRLHNVIGNRRSGKQVFYTLNGRVNVLDGPELHIRADSFNIAIRLRPQVTQTTFNT
jgi:DNA-binding transcriptional ArsR family regulator